MLPFLCWTDLDSMDRCYELAVGALLLGDSPLNLLLLAGGEPPMGTNIEQRPNWLEEARGVSDIFPTLPYLTELLAVIFIRIVYFPLLFRI